MSQTQKMKSFDIIKAARDKRKITIIFDLPIDGQVIKAELTAIDHDSILKEQNKIILREMAILEDEGMDKLPYVKSVWDKELKALDPEARKIVEKNPPENAADQQVKKFVWYETIKSLVPRYLRCAKEHDMLFNDESLKVFAELMKYDASLFTLLSEKWRELNEKLGTIGDEAKN